ncbi:glycosyltransferase [Luteibacter aegosomatissinici]|uniref:glycosyltransferase n=1 Tax=Luteibacter aegosomatissinici TaxID=2911539 RepID=UPI001FF743BC|nr:glycosyltransferase [Luteibacter aegosomatissinici]UPG95678.1 glycosyltransferase [Luteibacter aegosomatissinici]
MNERPVRPQLIVLASTYPRWKDDHEPSFVHELARRLTSSFDVVAVVPHAPGAAVREILDGVDVVRYRYAPAAFETLVNDGGIVTNLRRAPWKWLLVPSFAMGQWLAARRLLRPGTIVHAHWLVSPGAIARCLGAPYLLTSHGADLFALRAPLAVRLKRWVALGARRFAVVSNAMADEAVRQLGVPEVTVSPMGADLQARFTPDLSLVRDKDHLLFVGRLVEKKGIDILLHALPRVIAERAATRLTIVGHGPLMAQLRALAEELGIAGAVDFAGPLAGRALVDMYRRASLFVAPFRPATSGDQEGLGLVLVEALGCGLGVVASDVPAARDVLAEMPGASRVVPGDADALASEIMRRLESPSLPDAVAGRQALLDRFDWEAVTARYRDALLAIRDASSAEP